MTNRRRVLQLSVISTSPFLFADPAQAQMVRKPLVIGHRGASGYRPEHTLASYELATRLGADFIEPDLVTTRDRVLIARHENEISGTTDVASRSEFKGRKTTKTIDGVEVAGWFTEDFTLAELKTLRAMERIPAVRQRNTLYNGLFDVPTFDEVLRLRERLSKELHREIGVYPETKHPSYFRGIGLDLETPLLATLRRHGLDRPHAPVFIQSFESRNLRDLRRQTKVPLIFLVNTGASYDPYVTPDGLTELAGYVDGIGPAKVRIFPGGDLGSPSTLVANTHARGLAVHPWTFRAENQFLPQGLRVGTDANAYGKAIDEQIAYIKAGVDGLFSDQPDITVVARSLASASS